MTRLSNRQYPLFLVFTSQKYLSEKQAKTFDQRPFRSMLVHGWIAFKPEHGFYLTTKGHAAWVEFNDTEITRKNPSLPLTAYFHPEIYKLHLTKSIKKRAVA